MNQGQINDEYKRCLGELWRLIPTDEMRRVSDCGYCDLSCDFLGFIDTYWHISRMLDDRYTIIDFGCAFAPQSYFFRNFRRYIGVDLMCDTFFRQNEEDGNCVFYPHTDIQRWIEEVFPTLGLDVTKCFAIVNYVPDMHGRCAKSAKEVFPNIYTFYPTTFDNELASNYGKYGCNTNKI